MSPAVLVALACLAALVAAVGLVVVLEDRKRVRRELAGSRAEVESLSARIDQLAELLAAQAAERAAPPDTGYLITSAGQPVGIGGAADAGADDTAAARRASGGVVSVTLAEPLVKAVALGYGLRRALTAESRNRIVFEMRREIRRSRRHRRRETKRARQALRRAEREERNGQAEAA
jgi:hypothetical protein